MDTLVDCRLEEPKHTHFDGRPALRPERASWTAWEIYERPNGTRYKRTQRVHRWAGSYSCGDWETEEWGVA